MDIIVVFSKYKVSDTVGYVRTMKWEAARVSYVMGKICQQKQQDTCNTACVSECVGDTKEQIDDILEESEGV